MLDKSNKFGQLSDAMTWIVATIIVIIVLIAFVFVSSSLGGAKEISLKGQSFFEGDEGQETNWLEVKTSLAYNRNSQNKENIERWINEE